MLSYLLVRSKGRGVMDPPLGINHSRFDEGTSIDGEHENDQAEEGDRLESEEVEDRGPGSFL